MAMDIGYDTTFELNEFGQPKLRSELEVIKDVLMFILFAKPGQYPSLPLIGLDIGKMLYSFYDEIDCGELRTRIIEQCSALGIAINNGNIIIRKTKYRGQPSLLINVQGVESYPSGYLTDDNGVESKYLIGITYDEFKNMIYDINKGGV